MTIDDHAMMAVTLTVAAMSQSAATPSRIHLIQLPRTTPSSRTNTSILLGPLSRDAPRRRPVRQTSDARMVVSVLCPTCALLEATAPIATHASSQTLQRPPRHCRRNVLPVCRVAPISAQAAHVAGAPMAARVILAQGMVPTHHSAAQRTRSGSTVQQMAAHLRHPCRPQ